MKTSRRNFLRSAAGASLGLPFLESMAAVAAPAKRYAVFYVPIGVIRRSFFPGESEQKVVKFQGANTPILEGAKFGVGNHKFISKKS